jgi:hypothetical protein
MNKARLALLGEIDRPQRYNQNCRQMVSELNGCIEHYMTIVRQLKKASAVPLLTTTPGTIDDGGTTLTE